MMHLLVRLWRALFLRRRCYRLNRLLFGLSLRGMGLLNFESTTLSGEEHFLKRLSRAWNSQPGKMLVLLDVGANQGSYSLRLRQLNPAAEVFAFEPHPKTFALLQDAGIQHGFHTINAACSDHRGRLQLYDYAASATTTSGSQHASLHRGVLAEVHGAAEVSSWDVELITLDDFLQTRQIESVDLLKVDTEGHELKVLLGARRALADHRIKVIQFEFNEMNVASRVFLRDFLDLLQGYKLYRMVRDGLIPLQIYQPIQFELFGYQNLVATPEEISGPLEAMING